jgi:hypothetical protein
MRTCKKCLQPKELDMFKKHSSGYRHVCKKCQLAAEMTNPVAHANRLARMKKYRESEQGKLKEKAYAQSDIGKQIRKLAIKKYEQSSGKAKKVSRTINRRLNKIKRTPLWLTEFDKLKIQCFYSVAAMLTRENKEPWHVDHIVPLQGELVSGLHVPNNLQVIRGVDNIVKHNRFEVV